MHYTPLSPFMRRISHAHLRVIEEPQAHVSAKPVNKWELLRELSKAQAAFGITERDLTVLQGLLSFFPEDALCGTTEMVVFPSNATICERLNGMPCSTMRRHLARLVSSGLLLRRDSPNGKRYVRKQGHERIAFGFDLTPLYRRAGEIARAAEAVREAETRYRRLREIVSLMRRDLAALAEYGDETQPGLGLWDTLRDTAAMTAQALRRKLPIRDLEHFCTTLEALLDQARTVIDGPETTEMITNAARSEQHHLNTNKELLDSEPAIEIGDDATEAPGNDTAAQPDTDDAENARQVPKIPLKLVTDSCPTIRIYYQGEIRHWHQLFDAACTVRASMGINTSAWESALRVMGPEQASIVIAAMLERFADIRSPGGYLRALTSKTKAGEFSCGPMVMALNSRRGAT